MSNSDRDPTLQTERLILRRWEARHLEPLARLNGSAEVMKYFVAPLSQEETVAFIARIEDGFEKTGFGFWAVELKETGEFLGACGLFKIPWEPLAPQVEVGWRFLKEHWGKGYATEAAQAALDYGWSKGLDEIIAITLPINVPSQKVMERIGMKRDPAANFEHPRVPERHPYREHWLWRISRPT